MAYYCGECVVWVGSSDVDRYGRRWCSYSRKYEESNQNTYGCRGFVYNGRTVVTKVCEILHLPIQKWYDAFDIVKDAYVVPQHMDWLTSYCRIGPRIAEEMDKDVKREEKARKVLRQFMQPAYIHWQNGENEMAAKCYRKMILNLCEQYNI